jgi:release factor glutamine methyltransferase
MVRAVGDEIWTILKVLQWTQNRFRERGLASPRLDAEVLLAHVLGKERIALYTHHDQPLKKEELAAYRELIRRRLGGEPVAYLVGRREFWSLAFSVDERVLVPRPETELLVETVLALVAGRPSPRIADIGTGSGAIAIAVAHERPDAQVVAVDRSAGALEVARGNAEALDVDIELVEGDLLAPLAGREPFRVIASNPPYIPDGDFAGLPPEVKREPREALLAGADGLAVLRRLATGAPACLEPGGALAVEVGRGQAGAVAELFAGAGLEGVEVKRDLAGIERVVVARRG